MKLLNGHLNITQKSATAAAGSILGVVVVFGYLPPEKAAAISAAIAAVMAIVVPDRQQGADS